MKRLTEYAPAIAALALGLVVVVELEVHARAQATELAALHSDLAALREDVAAVRAHAASDVARELAPRTCALDAEVTRALTAAVAEGRGAPRTAAVTAAATPPEPPAPRTVEQEKSLLAANDRLESAIRRGHLTREDVQDLRTSLAAGAATQAETDEMRRMIAQAVNDRRLVPEDPRFLMP